MLPFVNGQLCAQIVSYLSDVGMNNKDEGYTLSPEFKEKNPKGIFKEYLKENEIELNDVTYPTSVTGFNSVADAEVATVKIIVRGKQNKKKFEKNLVLDFYFVPNKELREGGTFSELKNSDFEIMAVSTGTVSAEKFDKFFKFDLSKAKEKFRIS